MLYSQICTWFPGCSFSCSGPCELKTGHSCPPTPAAHLSLWWDKDRTTAIDALTQKGKNGRNIASLSVAIPESGGKNVARFPYFCWDLASRYLLLQRWWMCLDPSFSKALGTTVWDVLPFPLPALVTPEEKTRSMNNFSSFFLSIGHCTFWIIWTQPRGTYDNTTFSKALWVFCASWFRFPKTIPIIVLRTLSYLGLVTAILGMSDSVLKIPRFACVQLRESVGQHLKCLFKLLLVSGFLLPPWPKQVT